MQKMKNKISLSCYEWQLCNQKVIFIEDMNQGVTVTNNIENVLEEIEQELSNNSGGVVSIDDLHVIYRDTLGIIDGVKTSGRKFHSFFNINETDLEKALEKIQVRKGAANV